MTTKIKILRRSNQTMDKEHHIEIVCDVPADEVCVLYLGGNGTEDQIYPQKKSAEQVANGDVRRLRQEIVKPFFNEASGVDISVYAVAYDFDDVFDSKLEMRYDTGRHVMDITKKNLRRSFRKQIIPIISENGGKVSVDKIEHRWPRYARLFFADSDVEFEFDRMLYDTLQELKYTDTEIYDIEKLVERRKAAVDSAHITDLFNRVILPRLTLDGKRRNLNDALIQIRKITFVSHCYGALLVRKLQDEMRRKMPELGYSPDEIKTVLSQMLVVAHAPSGRLDKQTANFYSFASAFDEKMETPNNEIKSFITTRRSADKKIMSDQGLKDMEHTWMPESDVYKGMRAMFLPQNMGNMFVIPRAFDTDPNNEYEFVSENEHSNTSYVRQAGQNRYGWLLNTIERNVLINGIRNSLAQTDKFDPLPDLEDLIIGPNDTPEQRAKSIKIFEQMRQNGQKFLRSVFENAMAKLRARREVARPQHDTSRQV